MGLGRNQIVLYRYVDIHHIDRFFDKNMHCWGVLCCYCCIAIFHIQGIGNM